MTWTSGTGFGWYAAGTAADLVEGITAADDGKLAAWSSAIPGIGVGASIEFDFTAPDPVPESATITLKTGTVLFATQWRLTGIVVRDAANVAFLQWWGFTDLNASATEFEFELARVNSGDPDVSGDWTIELGCLVEGGVSTVIELDYLAIGFSGDGGGPIEGPGGQVSRNASFFLSLCGF